MPMSIGAYAAHCIFLIVLAVISRFLIAFRSVLEQRWSDAEINRQHVVAGRPNMGGGGGGESLATETHTVLC